MDCAPAQADVAIDDFSTGAFTKTLGVTGNSGWVGYQSGSMVGGSRAVAVATFDGIGEAQPTTVAVTPAGAFEVQSGTGISHRVNLIYGKTPNGDAPLALDLSKTDRIRIHFTHNNSPFNQINFNITMYENVSPYLQIGYNVPGSAVPFDWDFMFADGILGALPGVTKFDFSNVSIMDFQAQGGQDWGIDNIYAVSVPEPGNAALMFAGLGFLGWFSARRRTRARTQLVQAAVVERAGPDEPGAAPR